MKLTIGMIVKNEEKYLERCLNGIKPILDNVDSELIITDTGSTDKTEEIAEKFTDKVLHFDWCDDFSAARNFGLEKAQGEWFMFLDADDIFESCNGIIDFFKTGEYKKYNSAAYTSHNLTGSGNTFVDYRAPRLTKITPETKFEGVVHEHLNTFGEPLKNIYDMAVHFGYLFLSEEDRRHKFERNSKLLIKKLNSGGDSDPIIYSELFETFMGHDRTKAFEYLDAGINACLKQKSFLITVMYGLKAFAFYSENNYKQALKICDDYFKIDSSIKPGVTVLDMEIYAIKASSLFKTENYKEALEAYKYFFVIFGEVRSGKLHTSDMYAAQFRMVTETNYVRFMCDFLKCGIYTNSADEVLIFISNYPPLAYLNEYDITDELVDLEIRLMSKVGFKYEDSCINGLDEYGKTVFKRKKIQMKKDSDHIVLTIGMIVKNEEKWLDKCLSAIKPILDNVDSELIITDTGSIDRTVEIASKYTDKVLHFDWCDDFSAARNFGLEKARGKWFMMLDADDIFRSCDNIIGFFNSGEYKKYNAATYISRNLFKTENGDSYGDLLAPRMVRIHPDTKYDNAVHESLNTFQPPYKNLQDIADHYGYYYDTEDDKVRKINRNLKLLLKRFETEKETTPILYVQLYEAYVGMKEYDKALYYLDNGIELCKKANSIVLAALYFHKASYYQTERSFDESLIACDEYFKMNKAIRPYRLSTDGEIYAIKAMCLYELERYSDAVESFKKYFDIYRDIESGKLSTYDRYLYSAYLCSDINIMPLFNNFIGSCIKSEKYNTADNWLSTYPLYKYEFESKKIYELVRCEITVAEHFDYKNIDAYYKRLGEQGKKYLLDELLYLLGKHEIRTQLFCALDGIAKCDEKAAQKIKIYKAYYGDIDCNDEIVRFVGKYGISEDVDLMFVAIKLQYDISPIVLHDSFDPKQTAYICCRNIEGFYDSLENYDVDNITENKAVPIIVKFYDLCISMRLIDNEEKTENEKKKLISGLFRVKTELNERNKKTAAKSELEQLALAIKTNIRSYIGSGNMADARKTLEDYRKINPNDPEIKIIEQEIEVAT